MSVHFDGNIRIDDILLITFHFGKILGTYHTDRQKLSNPESSYYSHNQPINTSIDSRSRLLQDTGSGRPEDFRFEDVTAVAISHKFRHVDGLVDIIRLVIQGHYPQPSPLLPATDKAIK